MRQGRPVDTRADRALHRQVSDDLRDQIEQGSLCPGERLPGEVALAQMYGVGANTLRTALEALRREGLLVTERARRTYVRRLTDRSVVKIPPGARWKTRPATQEERDRLQLDDYEPVTEITLAGGDVQVVPAYQVEMEWDGGQDPTPHRD